MKMFRKIASVAAAASVCLALTACGTTKIDPKEICEVDFVGANGYAHAVLSVDYEDLEDYIIDGMGDTTKSERQEAAQFARSIKFVLSEDNNKNLSNGDEIEVTIEYDADDAKEDYNFTFKSETLKFKAADLDDAEALDPFQDIEIKYTGFSPKGQYSLSTSRCDQLISNNCWFEFVDAPDRVANGDILTVKVNYDENRILEEGYVIESETKDFVVSGLDEGKVIDPFAGLTIEYTGIAPYAEAHIDTTNCDDYVKNNVDFRIDNNGQISNGEVIAVSARYDTTKAEQNGIVFSEEEKNFTAEGVPVYMTQTEGVDLTGINGEYLDYVTQRLSNGDSWYVGNNSKSISYLTGCECSYYINEFTLTPQKAVLLSTKNPKNSSTQNKYVIIYKAEGTFEKTSDGWWCKCENEKGDTVKAYFYVQCYASNIAVNADKTINKDKMSSFGYEIYWPKDYSFDAKKLNAQMICDKWKAQNTSDFNFFSEDVK